MMEEVEEGEWGRWWFEDEDWKRSFRSDEYGEGLKMQNDLGVKVRVNLKVVKWSPWIMVEDKFL